MTSNAPPQPNAFSGTPKFWRRIGRAWMLLISRLLSSAFRCLAAGSIVLATAATIQAQGTGPRAAPLPPTSGASFCSSVQQILAGTALVARNTVHGSFDAFVRSKPQLHPLETQQFVEYADAAHTKPMLIWCKTKSADQLNEVYGAGTALDDPYSCRWINRRIIVDAWNDLSSAERAAAKWPPNRIMLDDDQLGFMGSQFIKPYTFLYLGADGLPHVLAKAQYAGWTDWRFKFMPERFRGTHYCRLMAPEYARRLIRGEAAMPATSH